MRVLHVISGLDPANGGPTIALVGLAEAQARAGLDVSVLATWQNQTGFPVAEQMRAAGVKVNLIGPASGKLSRHPSLVMATEGAVGRAEVVHVHALWEEIQHRAMRAAKRQGVPYVVTPHGMLSPWSFSNGSVINRLGKRAYLTLRLRRGLAGAAALHYTTVPERELASRLGLGSPTLIEPCGLDWTEFSSLPEGGRFRSRFPEIGHRPMLLFLGRLSAQKGLDALIPAFGQFCRLNPDAVLVIAGPDYDGYSRTVARLIEEHVPNARVLQAGMQAGRERVEAMVDADLFVLSSHHENFGIVVAEAMACATPVVISRDVNVWQEVEAAGAGEAASRAPAELAAAMVRWMADPQRRQEAGERGRAYARAHWDWDLIAQRWADHYAHLKVDAPEHDR